MAEVVSAEEGEVLEAVGAGAGIGTILHWEAV